jgi:hypothetical protein
MVSRKRSQRPRKPAMGAGAAARALAGTENLRVRGMRSAVHEGIIVV